MFPVRARLPALLAALLLAAGMAGCATDEGGEFGDFGDYEADEPYIEDTGPGPEAFGEEFRPGYGDEFRRDFRDAGVETRD